MPPAVRPGRVPILRASADEAIATPIEANVKTASYAIGMPAW